MKSVNMNRKRLDRLLGKYYKGSTTEEEEMSLRQYFSSQNIPEGYETEARIFEYYSFAGKIPQPSDNFEQKIVANLEEAVNREKETRGSKRYLRTLISIAAGLLIITGSYFFFNSRGKTIDTYSDPEVAYAEAYKILLDVSVMLNRGEKALEPLSEFNEVTRRYLRTLNRQKTIIENNMNSLYPLQKLSDVSDNQIDN